ncbi:MAG: hypothetical protein ACEPOV_03830 [Hyphomicrobiales bacterium]
MKDYNFEFTDKGYKHFVRSGLWAVTLSRMLMIVFAVVFLGGLVFMLVRGPSAVVSEVPYETAGYVGFNYMIFGIIYFIPSLMMYFYGRNVVKYFNRKNEKNMISSIYFLKHYLIVLFVVFVVSLIYVFIRLIVFVA